MRYTTLAMIGLLFAATASCGDDSSPAADSAVPDTMTADMVAADTVAADTVAADTVAADTVAADASKVDTSNDTAGTDAPAADTATADGPPADKSTTDFGPVPDYPVADFGTPTDAQKAACGSSKVVLQEVAVGAPDYVALKNTGSTSVSLTGIKLEMTGISVSSPDTFTFTTQTIAAGATLYVFEHSTGKKAGDVNTGANIPFYDGPPSAMKENAVTLYDGSGKVLDYWAVGTSAVNKPTGINFLPLPWYKSFDSAKHSFQRVKTGGVCPNFQATDWGVASITRP